jgi:hypothetical protein
MSNGAGKRLIMRAHDTQGTVFLGAVATRTLETRERLFTQLSHEEIAELWQVSARTVQRDWDKARFLLSNLMEEPATPAARTS